jgi:hypothetical protein
MYKGVAMRSRLEANFAAALDKWGHPWVYEPHCFADETGQYLPDFRIDIGQGQHAYVEVKPPSITEEELAAAQRRMEIIWSSEPSVGLSLHVWGTGRHYVATGAHRDWRLIRIPPTGPRGVDGHQ